MYSAKIHQWRVQKWNLLQDQPLFDRDILDIALFLKLKTEPRQPWTGAALSTAKGASIPEKEWSSDSKSH